MKKFLKGFCIFVALMVLIQVFFYWQATRSPQWEYARRALDCKQPNYDLTYCVDLPASDRKDFTNSSFKPLVCINTASSCYNYRHRAITTAIVPATATASRLIPTAGVSVR